MITSPVLVIKKDAILPKSEVITSEKKMTSYGNMTNAEVEEGNLLRVGVLCDSIMKGGVIIIIIIIIIIFIFFFFFFPPNSKQKTFKLNWTSGYSDKTYKNITITGRLDIVIKPTKILL
jgi:hypothetical protein